MLYARVRGWTSGRSLPVQNFVKYAPPPPQGDFHNVVLQKLQNTSQGCENPVKVNKDINKKENNTIRM